MYNDVHQLMLSGAKCKHVYQGSLVVQQAPATKSGDVDYAGASGEPSGSTSQSGFATGEIGNATMSENPPMDNNDDIYTSPPTLPPPAPSPLKWCFSASEC